MPNLGRIRKIERQINQSKKALALARMRLAAITKPGDAAVLVSSEWNWVAKLMSLKSHLLRSFPGVVGYSLGFRHRDGNVTNDPCITVFVRKKYTPKELSERALRP